MMKIHTLPIGPVQANCYVVIDERRARRRLSTPAITQMNSKPSCATK